MLPAWLDQDSLAIAPTMHRSSSAPVPTLPRPCCSLRQRSPGLLMQTLQRAAQNLSHGMIFGIRPTVIGAPIVGTRMGHRTTTDPRCGRCLASCRSLQARRGVDGTDVRISLGRDLFFLYWLENYLQSRHGFSVTYDVMGDEDVHAIGSNVSERGDNGLLRYRVVVTGAHPEYWTDEMRIAVDDYVQRGGRLMYLSGNGRYWVTSVNSSRPHILEVRKRVNLTNQSQVVALPGEYHHSTTGELGGLWRDVGYAPQKLFGVGYAAGDAEGWGTPDSPTPFFRLNPAIPANASFIVEGVVTTDFLGAGYGVFGQSALSDEVDRYDTRLGSRPDTTVVATGQWPGPNSLTKNPLPEDRRDFGTCHTDVECAKSLLRADVVYFRKGAGEVFAAGSRLWTAALMDTHAPNDFSTITANVLKHFLNM